MGILVNVISADEEDLESIIASQHPVDEWSGIEARDIDRSKFITLHCLLTGDGLEDAVYFYEPVFADFEDGPIVLRIPDELTEKLASLEEDALEIVGEELAATEDFETSDFPLEEIQALISEMAALARIADSQTQTLFIWMHPLMT
jgi:hypothetical protein